MVLACDSSDIQLLCSLKRGLLTWSTTFSQEFEGIFEPNDSITVPEHIVHLASLIKSNFYVGDEVEIHFF